MIEQLFFKNVGGSVQYTEKPQDVMLRNPERIGGHVANNGPGPLAVFAGDVVTLEPFKAMLIPEGYQGPVKITGEYGTRFQAVEFIKDPHR